MAAGLGDSADTALARSAHITLIAIGPLLVADSANWGIDQPQNYLGPIAQSESADKPMNGTADRTFKEHCPEG